MAADIPNPFDVAKRVERLVHEVIDGPPQRQARVIYLKGPEHSVLTLHVQPDGEGCAELFVSVDDRGAEVAISFGELARFEIGTTGWRQTELPDWLDEARLVVEGVVEGRGVERLWCEGSRILRSEFVVSSTNETEMHGTALPSDGSGRGGVLRTIEYRPYEQLPVNDSDA